MTQPSPQPPQKPIEERLVDLAIKVLAGVSGGSSLVFLVNNEISKAAIAGALAGGFTILSSFREGMMKHLKDWANQYPDRIIGFRIVRFELRT